MTLYVVQARGDDSRALERATFVAEGFSGAAFVFGPLWLLYRQLWLALLVWILLEVAYVAFVYPHVGAGVTAAVDTLAHLFVGLEGNRLRQRKLERSARITDLVEARNRDEAEVIFYRRIAPTEADA